MLNDLESSSVWRLHNPEWSVGGSDDVLPHHQQREDQAADQQDLALHQE